MIKRIELRIAALSLITIPIAVWIGNFIEGDQYILPLVLFATGPFCLGVLLEAFLGTKRQIEEQSQDVSSEIEASGELTSDSEDSYSSFTKSNWHRGFLGVMSVLLGLMELPMGFDPPRPELGILNFGISAFCFLIGGACLLPRTIRRYCGDVIALLVVVMAIWFLSTLFGNEPQEGNPILFAVIFGGGAIRYLYGRYREVFSS